MYEERLARYGLIKISEGIFQETAIKHRLGTRWFKATPENLKLLNLKEVSKGLYVQDKSGVPQEPAAAAPPPAAEAGGLADLAPGGFDVPAVLPTTVPAYSVPLGHSPIPFQAVSGKYIEARSRNATDT